MSICHSPERAGDGGDEEEADRHKHGAHLHPLRTSVVHPKITDRYVSSVCSAHLTIDEEIAILDRGVGPREVVSTRTVDREYTASRRSRIQMHHV